MPMPQGSYDPAHNGTYALPRLRVKGAHIAGYALPLSVMNHHFLHCDLGPFALGCCAFDRPDVR